MLKTEPASVMDKVQKFLSLTNIINYHKILAWVIILEGLGVFVTVNVGFYSEMTQFSADHGPFSLRTGLIRRKASGVSCWREERPSVWERVKDADTLTWTRRFVPILSVCAFFCGCFLNLMVCFSLRRSSGSTTGITTLSCPNCSTGWASLCPAGSAKNWSTAGSGTAAGAHSFAQWTTDQLCRETGLAWPKRLKIPNICEGRCNMKGRFRQDCWQLQTKPQSSQMNRLKKGWWVSKKMVASSSWWFCPHLLGLLQGNPGQQAGGKDIGDNCSVW